MGFGISFTGSTSNYSYPPLDQWPSSIPASVAKKFAGQPIIPANGKTSASAIAGKIVSDLQDKNAQTLFAPYGFDILNVLSKNGTSSTKAFDAFLNLAANNNGGSLNVPVATWAGVANNLPSDVKKVVDFNVPGLGAVATTPNASDTTKATAYDNTFAQLEQLGLGDLAPVVYKYVFQDGLTNPKMLWDAVRQTPEYKNTFQGLDQHNATQPQKLNEAQYLALSQTMLNTAQQYGLPSSAVTPKEIGQLIGAGVSAAEFSRRVANGYVAAQNADPNVKAALAAQGVTMGDLAHYYLDPKAGEQAILQKTMTAQMQGYAKDVGVNIDGGMAQQLATEAKSQLNPDGTYSLAKAQSALDYAAQRQNLTGAAPGAAAPTVSTAQLIGSQIAGFQGTTQAQAQRAVDFAAQGAAAPFEKGGGYESTGKGVEGVGYARQ